MTTNSSPPIRATRSPGRTLSRSRVATSTSRSSPPLCPTLSLTAFSRSRSQTSRPVEGPVPGVDVHAASSASASRSRLARPVSGSCVAWCLSTSSIWRRSPSSLTRAARSRANVTVTTRKMWSSVTAVTSWPTARTNGPCPAAVKPLATAVTPSAVHAVPRVPNRTAAQAKNGISRYGMVTIHRPPAEPNTTAEANPVATTSATSSLGARRCAPPRPRITGATTRTPRASPRKNRDQSARKVPSPDRAEASAPVVAPTRGPAATANEMKRSSGRTGSRSPLGFPNRRSSTAATKGSSVLANAQPRVAPSGWFQARSPASSARATAPSAQTHCRAGTSSRTATLSPAAGQSPALLAERIVERQDELGEAETAQPDCDKQQRPRGLSELPGHP